MTPIGWLKKHHYKSMIGFIAAALILALLRRDEDIYMAECVNFAYGYSYYFFAKKGDQT